jgi:hypothetical protein
VNKNDLARSGFNLDETEFRSANLLETKKDGIRSKAAKTKAGWRDITLPELLVETLRVSDRRCWKFSWRWDSEA